MSATDDASPDSQTRTTARPLVFITAACGLALGALAFATLAPQWLPRSIPRFEARAPWIGEAPEVSAWPRAPLAGESARVRGEEPAREIVITAHDAADAGTLASALAWERNSGSGIDHARCEAFANDLRGYVFIGPLYRMAPAAECAALLRAYAGAARGLLGPDDAGEPGTPDAAEMVTSLAIEEAARAQDPAVLSDALAASLIVERERLARDAALDPPSETALRASWEQRLRRFATDLEGLAVPIAMAQTPLQQELIATVTPGLALSAAPRIPTPSQAILETSLPSPAPRVRPIAAMGWGLGALGGLLGAALGFVAGYALAKIGRRTMASPRARGSMGGSFSAPPPALEAGDREPVTAEAWLQIVSGARPRDVASGVMEIAAQSAAMGARVLVVDAGRSLALHRAFAAEGKPGLVECLSRPLPALGVVQQGGAPRVLLLAFGDSRQRPVWPHLDHLLEEVRPHCDRLVLALAADSPREIGSVLAGRVMDGWWAGPAGRGSSASGRIAGRIGIAFHPLELDAGHQPTVEMLRHRIAELQPAPFETVPPLPPAASEPEPARPVVIEAPAEVLDSDLQVRERLRFLAWMRRVQAEGRREELITKD